MSTRSVGDVRPSQVITTFGPGAIVDLQTVSVIVAGIDRWPIDEDLAIHEPRLQRALRVKRFFAAKPTEGGGFRAKRGTVPTYLFPRYQVCPVCQTLSVLGEGHTEFDSKWGEVACTSPGCKGRGQHRATTVPAPFVVACPGGHIDDFPWRDYVHRGSSSCRGKMQLYSSAKTGTVADMLVHCECGKTRSVSDAFGDKRFDAIGNCTRRRPWLGSTDSAACKHAGDARAMQRGATNAWFPIQRSALAVKEAATPLGEALAACSPKQIEKIDSLDKLKLLVEMQMFPTLTTFPLDEVWSAIRRERGELETADIDLRWPEWLALRDPASSSSDKNEFFLEAGEVCRLPPQRDHLIFRMMGPGVSRRGR